MNRTVLLIVGAAALLILITLSLFVGALLWLMGVSRHRPVDPLVLRSYEVPHGQAEEVEATVNRLLAQGEGQAIGRAGDFINGEHFAKATDLPWAFRYTNPNTDGPWATLVDGEAPPAALWHRGEIGQVGEEALAVHPVAGGYEPILDFFSDDPEVILIGAGAMVFVSLFQFFDAMNISYLNALQGAGDNLWPSLANGVLCVVVLLGGGLVVVHFYPEAGSRGIWAVTGLYILGQGLAFRGRWMGGKWKSIDLFEDGDRDG